MVDGKGATQISILVGWLDEKWNARVCGWNRGKFSTVRLSSRNILARGRIQHVCLERSDAQVAVYPWQLVRRRPSSENSRDVCGPNNVTARASPGSFAVVHARSFCPADPAR